jgi:preprotein translocase subunit SecF
MLNIVGHKKIWFTFSGILILLAICAMVFYGFKQSAEFQGGTLWEFSAAADNPSLSDVQNIFAKDLNISGADVTLDSSSQTFIVRFDSIDEATHQRIESEIKDQLPSFSELSFESVGPSVGASLRQKSIIALFLVIIGISLYIAYAFRKASRPVSSWKYGFVTLFTLFHDVVIPAGVLALLGHLQGVEVDSNAVVALLVVMGFSVHDTIVVFDRIRENLFLDRGKTPFTKVVNDSVNQTMARSINTSLTLILVLLALYFAGPASLHAFVIILLVGVTTGIYSSIFIASPILSLAAPKDEKKN